MGQRAKGSADGSAMLFEANSIALKNVAS